MNSEQRNLLSPVLCIMHYALYGNTTQNAGGKKGSGSPVENAADVGNALYAINTVKLEQPGNCRPFLKNDTIPGGVSMDQLALVIAAGEGTRMLSDLPKPLHPICGIPMVEHVLQSLNAVTAQRAMVIRPEQELIPKMLHVECDFLFQDSTKGRGTGNALLSAISFLQGKSGQVIVTACDKPLVLPETYMRLLEEVKRGASCSLLTGIVDNPLGYSRVIRQGGRVCACLRQNALTGEQYMIKEVDASVYCFDIEALLEALPQLPEDSDHEKSLSDIVGIISAKGALVSSVPALEKCETMGVNDRIQLADAEKAMRRRINVKLMRSGVTLLDPDTTYIQPDVSIGQDTVIGPGCVLERGTTIDSGCTILFSHIAGSYIGSGAHVEYSTVEDTSVPSGAKVGPYQVLTRKSSPVVSV